MLYGSSPSDFGFLPPQFNGDVQVYSPTGITQTATSGWQTWNKPKGISMVYMIAIGGGGGGGGGFGNTTGTTRGGGGGGACSGFATLMMPAIFLPDSLKIMVGMGGQGGAGSTGGAAASAGNAGSISYVSMGAGLTTGITIPSLILSSGNSQTGGGAAGTGAAGGTGGTVPTVPTIATVGPLGKLGLWPNTGTAANNGYVGVAGSNGGAQTGAIGTALNNVLNVTPLSPGTGGAGINTALQAGFAGGVLNLQATLEFTDNAFGTIQGGVAGGIVNAGNGNRGHNSYKPFINTGGTGGGSADSALGGNGGMGGVGCGGGGGGAGTTGGRGGIGGPGMVAIICW
jgi:hypothetical protein